MNILLFIAALIGSAFFSGYETALISTSRIKLEVWIRRNIQGARQAFEFVQHPEHSLTTTLVGNNIALVAASSILAVYLEQIMSGFTITLVSSVFLLLFGEILPKSIAQDRPTAFVVRFSFILRLFSVLLYPIIWVVMRISRLILRIFGLDSDSLRRFFTRKDLEMLVREGEDAGLVDRDERTMISRFILGGDRKVRDIMIPRTEIVSIPKTATVKSARELLIKNGFSRMPVTGENDDEILGMITAMDLIVQRPRAISTILREIVFAPEVQSVGDLMRALRDKNIGMAVIVDEYGGTAGLVTLEDILEEFFGEIQDETDEEAMLYRRIAPHQIEVNARVTIQELNERFHLLLPEGEYQTLGGLLIERLGRIPKRGEKIWLDSCQVLILSAYREKINWVRILPHQPLTSPQTLVKAE